MDAKDRGYLDGLTDARNGRTPEHSHTAYTFPRQGTMKEQADYNNGYSEAKAKYSEASQLEAQWQAKQVREIFAPGWNDFTS